MGRGTGIVGTVVGADTTLRQAESHDLLFEADGAIGVGEAVALDTGNTAGKLVVVCPAGATADHRAIGIYQGEGGSGAQTTTTGLSGRAAVDGDFVWIRVSGIATALVDGTTTDANDGDVLSPSLTTAGELVSLSTTFDAGDFPIFTCIEANAGATAAKKVFVRSGLSA